MDKRFWAVIGIIVVIFGGIFFFTKQSNGSDSASAGTPTNHVEGAKDAKVTLLEYGDYQCPVCGTYYPIIKQVTDKYASVMKFQFRNYPLTSIHPNAFAGARAAEAADKQGKYFEMHDLLYTNQAAWSEGTNPNPYFEQYAKQLNLDTAKFKTDFSSSAVNDAVNADLNEAKKLKLSATPTFFLNGQQLSLQDLVDTSAGNQPTLEKFSKLIDAKLKAAGVEPPAASTPATTESTETTAQ